MSTAYVGSKTLTTGNKAYASDLKDLIKKGSTLKTWSYTDWDATGDYPFTGLGYLSPYYGKQMLLIWKAYAGTDYTLTIPQSFTFNVRSEDHYKYGWQHYLTLENICFPFTGSSFRFGGAHFDLAHGEMTGGDSNVEIEPEDLRGENLKLTTRLYYTTICIAGANCTFSNRSTFNSDNYYFPYKLIDLNMGTPQ